MGVWESCRVKLINNGHPFCKAFVATLKGWPLLRGFIYLKITGLRSCHLSLIQGLALVQGGGALLGFFTIVDYIGEG